MVAWVPRRRGNFGGHLPVHCEVQETPGVRQSYSVDGSNDAASSDTIRYEMLL